MTTPCTKRAYVDRQEAQAALNATRRSRAANRQERRVYCCLHCQQWHLTSAKLLPSLRRK